MTPDKMYQLNKTMTCEEIAQVEGVTKNSIVGKIYRYRQRTGLPPASDRAPFETVNVKRKAMQKTHKKTMKPRKAKKEKPKHKTLADLGAKDCRYPYGDKLPYTFCGQRQKEGSVYCEEHEKLCHDGGHRKQWYEKKYG